MNAHNNGKTQIVATEEPIILFTPRALSMMSLIVEKSPQEVGWFGSVRTLSPMKYLVEDIYLCEQKAGAVECDIDQNSIAGLAEGLMTEPDGFEKINRIRLWGHSHGPMGVSPSTTDDNTFEDFYKACDDFFIMLIMNKAGNIRCEIALQSTRLIYKNCDWAVYCEEHEELEKEISQQIKDLLKPITTTPVNANNFRRPWLWDDNDKDDFIYGNLSKNRLPAKKDSAEKPDAFNSLKKNANGGLAFPKKVVDEVFSEADYRLWIQETTARQDIVEELAQYIIHWPLNSNIPLCIENVLEIDEIVAETIEVHNINLGFFSRDRLYRVEVAMLFDLFEQYEEILDEQIAEEAMQDNKDVAEAMDSSAYPAEWDRPYPS